MRSLTAEGLTKRYRGGALALDALDLEVLEGQTFGLLGPNGAGKSTFIRCALDLIRPTSGSVQLLGMPSTDKGARVGVGSIPESPKYPSHLTTIELMRLQSRLAGLDPGRDQVIDLLEAANLAPDLKVGSLSKGMLKQLAIAQALLGDPRLVLMDEPTADLDPLGRRHVRDTLLALKQAGVSVVLNSHLLSEVERTCDRVAIMHKGRIIASGTIEELVPEGSDLETVFIDLVTRAGG